MFGLGMNRNEIASCIKLFWVRLKCHWSLCWFSSLEASFRTGWAHYSIHSANEKVSLSGSMTRRMAISGMGSGKEDIMKWRQVPAPSSSHLNGVWGLLTGWWRYVVLLKSTWIVIHMVLLTPLPRCRPRVDMRLLPHSNSTTRRFWLEPWSKHVLERNLFLHMLFTWLDILHLEVPLPFCPL